MSQTPSPLERQLLEIRAIDPSCEWQIDILREVLFGTLGTENQRATLIRIIKENQTKKPIMPVLYPRGLEEDLEPRNSYI